MLNIQKMIASARACLGWPYVSPGTNDSNGIDCSGLFVKIFRDQGGSIYHGSNSIYRKHCGEKGQLTSEKQLIPGMAVFKWNPNTPEKFNDGLGDFQHIGLVVSTNPLEIIHASSAAGCVTTDTKIGKWKYWGKLKDVDYGATPIPATPSNPDVPVEEEPESVVVEKPKIGYINADKVNFRTGPSTKKPRIEYLNTGDSVEILGETGSWLKCRAIGRVGYIMAEFVSMEQVVPVDEGSMDERTMDEGTVDEGPADEGTVDWMEDEGSVPEEKTVWISASNGKRINIRTGNGLSYGRLTSVQSGTALPYVAIATNGWLAVKVKNAVGWVSPEFGMLGVG